MQEHIQPFLISFLIGLVIGIDRERSLPKGMKGMGVRSFSLVAMLGTLVSTVNEAHLTIIISSFVLLAILLNYHYTAQKQDTAKSPGMTTGLGAVLVYVLGYITPKEPLLSAVVGGASLLILVGREALHSFAKEKLQPKEIRAAATMVLIVMCVMVFMPDRTVDPWDLFNPRRFGLLVAIIAAMQFSGYVAIRVFGDKLGVLFMGLFGGLVSSTAVIATLPRFVNKHPERIRSASAAALLATVGMLVEFLILMLFAAPKLFVSVVFPAGAMILSGVLMALALYHRERTKESISEPKNPLDLKAVIYLSFVIGGMIIAVAVAKRYIGIEGVQIISFLGALFELHGVSLATATLFVGGKLPLSDATTTLLLALLASYLTKFVLLFGLARNRYGALTSVLLLVMMACGFGAVFLNGYTWLTG